MGDYHDGFRLITLGNDLYTDTTHDLARIAPVQVGGIYARLQ
jgi:hypothetical protein